jgi:hypothetical protein
LRAWRAYLPLERLTRDGRPYRRLCTITLEFGRQDKIASVRLGTLAFARELQRAGIRHTLDEYTGGHTDHTRQRFEGALLPFFARVFSKQDERGACRVAGLHRRVPSRLAPALSRQPLGAALGP